MLDKYVQRKPEEIYYYSAPFDGPHVTYTGSFSLFTPTKGCLKMRQTQIFSGSSHPALVERICDRLGQQAGKAELRKFSNGETSVQIRRLLLSIRLETETDYEI